MKATTVAFLTEATCGEACWKAKEEVCHCSCGGKTATPQQASVWPELGAFKELSIQEWRCVGPCLLWKRVEKGEDHGQAC